MSGPLRVGVIGCGGIAQMMHLPTIAERPDLFRLTALADVDLAVLGGVGERYGGALFADYRELLALREVDAVLLCASGSHREAALAAIAAKKHLFVEKPLAYTRGEIEEIGRAADVSSAVLFVGYHKRYDPAYGPARDAVHALEGLRFVEVTALHPDDGAYRAHHALISSRSKEQARANSSRETAIRVLNESLIHDLNLVRSILGEPSEVLSAHAWHGGLAQTSTTRFANDVSAVLNWISTPELKHYEERLRFIGARGRVTLTFPSPYLRHAPTPLSIERMDRGELIVEERIVSHEEAFRAELYAFHRAAREGSEPETSWKDALGDARFIEKIAEKLVVTPA